MSDQLNRIELALSELLKGQNELKQEVGFIKEDISSLKTDVSGLKTDVSELKTDVSTLKGDVISLKTDVTLIKGQLDRIEQSQNEDVIATLKVMNAKLEQVVTKEDINFLAGKLGQHDLEIDRLKRIG